MGKRGSKIDIVGRKVGVTSLQSLDFVGLFALCGGQKKGPGYLNLSLMRRANAALP
jgi:hypothetical protein